MREIEHIVEYGGVQYTANVKIYHGKIKFTYTTGGQETYGITLGHTNSDKSIERAINAAVLDFTQQYIMPKRRR